MLRLIFASGILLSGCSSSSSDDRKDDVIRIGDSVHSVRSKLKQWGAKEAHFAFSYGLKNTTESQSEFEERMESFRIHNDFYSQPYFWLAPNTAGYFESLDGKLVAIGKTTVIGPYAGNRTSESGFRSVDSAGQFSR